MPKEGKTLSEWNVRLRQYARGIKFGSGEAPGKPEVRAAVAAIDKCSLLMGKSGKSSIGRYLQGSQAQASLPEQSKCTCGYHKNYVPPQPKFVPNLVQRSPRKPENSQQSCGNAVEGNQPSCSSEKTGETDAANEARSYEKVTVPGASASLLRRPPQKESGPRQTEAPVFFEPPLKVPRPKRNVGGSRETVEDLRPEASPALATHFSESQDSGVAFSTESQSETGTSATPSFLPDEVDSLPASVVISAEPLNETRRPEVTQISSAEAVEWEGCDAEVTSDPQASSDPSTSQVLENSTIKVSGAKGNSPRRNLNLELSPITKRQSPSHISYLPLEMRKDLRVPPDHLEWIAQILYRKRKELREHFDLWYYPSPAPGPQHHSLPAPEDYFGRRLCVWAPVRAWKYVLTCPKPGCNRTLHKEGFHRRLRLVIDFKDCYYLVTEVVHCSACRRSYLTSAPCIMEQLREGDRDRFPALLTKNYACDLAVVTMLRSRTKGNSSTAFCNSINEVHSEEWLKKLESYLTACERHKQRELLGATPVEYNEPNNYASIPSPRWFTLCYIKDVYSRINYLRAAATSAFGAILKIDSTKKITGKLQGEAKGTAMWCTNVGNELGEILACVFTNSESTAALQRMADGVMARYERAQVSPPKLLYADKDCCRKSAGKPQKFKELFYKWTDLEVRLDIWHFMRRLANGCTTESHPLFPTFMGQLSACIFEWDEADVQRLRQAKKAEKRKRRESVTEDSITKAITKDELAKHCRRRTRGAEATAASIDALLASLSSATDSLGVPLFRENMMEIWSIEKRHLHCIQDPEGIHLYIVTDYSLKAEVRLPVYKCGRGSTSLENFHLHLLNFVPGTTTSAVHMQAYLLDGITRWNALRRSAAIASPESPTGTRNSRIVRQDISDNPLRTFDMRLQERVEKLACSVFRKSVFPNYRAPMRMDPNNHELIGLEYLDNQSDLHLPSAEDIMEVNMETIDDLIEKEDEGFVFDMGYSSASEDFLDRSAFSREDEEVPVGPTRLGEGDKDTSGSSEDEGDQEAEDLAVVDPNCIPGWDKVDRLAAELVTIRGRSVSIEQVTLLTRLYLELDEADRRSVIFRPSYPTRFSSSSFARQGVTAHMGAQATKRAFLSAVERPRSPKGSRIVEAVCFRLLNIYRSNVTEPVFQSRYGQVVRHYSEIRGSIRLLQDQLAKHKASFSLFCINESVLQKWHKEWERKQQPRELLQEQGISIPVIPATGAPQLPPIMLPSTAPSSSYEPLETQEPNDRVMEQLYISAYSQQHPRGDPAGMMQQPAAVSANTTGAISTGATASVSDATTSRGSYGRATQFKHAKLLQKGLPLPKPRNPARCMICKKIRSEDKDHKNLRGKWYCPEDPAWTSFEQWRESRLAELASKGASKEDS